MPLISTILRFSAPFTNLTRNSDAEPQTDTQDLEDGFYSYLTFGLIFLVSSILFCCALPYIIRRLYPDDPVLPQQDHLNKTTNQSLPKSVRFEEHMEIEMTGSEAGCAICLSEFVNGEEIRVLPRCKHGFHVQCIHGWLSSSQDSCPTCRTSCLLNISSEENLVSRENNFVSSDENLVSRENNVVVNVDSPSQLPLQQNHHQSNNKV